MWLGFAKTGGRTVSVLWMGDAERTEMVGLYGRVIVGEGRVKRSASTEEGYHRSGEE